MGTRGKSRARRARFAGAARALWRWSVLFLRAAFKASAKTAKFLARHKKFSACLAAALVAAYFCFWNKKPSAYSYRSAEELAYLKVLKARYSGAGRSVPAAAAAFDIDRACAFAAKAESNPALESPDVKTLLLATAAAESDLRARFQDSGGDAIGLFQIEYGTFRDLWRRAIPVRRPALWRAMRERFGGAVDGDIKFEELQKNDTLCALFALVKYSESGRPFPPASDFQAQARFYKEIYNTALGAGSEDRFLAARRRFGEN